jgi:hypothetical protein
MNQLAHMFITYLAFSLIIPETQKFIIPIFIFSIILDFDHIPGYIKILTMGKKEKAKLKIGDYVDIFRTDIQEPIGILTILLFLVILYLFGVRSVYLTIAGLSVLIHWLIDFLTVHTRPFSPLNKRIISVFFHTNQERKISEILITAVSLVLFLIAYY